VSSVPVSGDPDPVHQRDTEVTEKPLTTFPFYPGEQ
jgi:hypothetical protein